MIESNRCVDWELQLGSQLLLEAEFGWTNNALGSLIEAWENFKAAITETDLKQRKVSQSSWTWQIKRGKLISPSFQ